MLRIPCPWCGPRDEVEFRYRGDATRTRPGADAALADFTAYVYTRDNPLGWHLEWWLHTGGCRKLLKVLRTAEDGSAFGSFAVPATTRPMMPWAIAPSRNIAKARQNSQSAMAPRPARRQ